MRSITKVRMVTPLSLVALLALGAAAWACTPSPQVQLSRVHGPAAAEVSVVGSIFPPVPVEIKWDSEYGSVIGNGQGPNFSTTIKVPADAAPGLHYLYYTFAGDVEEAYDGFNGGAFAIFEVTSGAAQPGATPRVVAEDLWGGFSDGSEAATADSAALSPERVTNRSGLAAGVALFAAGMGVTLFAAVLLSRRRTSQASRDSRAQP